MKTAGDLFHYIDSLKKKEQYNIQYGIVHICIYSTNSSRDAIHFSVGLDEYAADIRFIGRIVNNEFVTFDVYPHETGKPDSHSVSWRAKQTFRDLLEMCPDGKNIQIITGSLRRMLGEEDESLL